VKGKKKKLLEVFDNNPNGKEMISEITTFVKNNNMGMVIFRYNGDLSCTKLVNLPLYYLTPKDFGADDKNIIFHIKENK
jgi:hypothetical protein